MRTGHSPMSMGEQARVLIEDLGEICCRHAVSWDLDGFSRDIDVAINHFVLESDLTRKDVAGLLRSYARWQLLRAFADIAER